MIEKFSPATYFQDVGAWPKSSHNIRRMYVIGFVLSILLTLTSYYFASAAFLPQQALFISLAVLACVQFAVQVYCFLHLGREGAARERLIILGFAIVIVFILTAGSLWIMFSLNSRMMPSTQQMEQFMNNQTGI